MKGLVYTLYMRHNLILPVLAVSVAFKGGLFKSVVKGQAYIGGLGVVLVCLSLDKTHPFYVIAPLAN